MEVEPDVRRRMRGKTRTVSADQPIAPIITQILQYKRRVDDPETPLSPVAQNEAPVLDPVLPERKREKMRSLQVFRCLRSQKEWAMISLKVGS